MKDDSRNRELIERFQEEDGKEPVKKLPFKTFNLNVEDGKKEDIDKLLGELKSYFKTKDLSKSKPKSNGKRLISGHEDVPVLIKPLVTDMKEFFRKVEDSKFDQKSAQFKSLKVHNKLTENMFQPIHCEKPKFSRTESEDFENILLTKNDKTIHESLRMSKTKRRKSLPSFDEPKESWESLSNTVNENSKSYNISYYTSIFKGKQSDTGRNEYNLSSLNEKGNKGKKTENTNKSVSDDYVYGAHKTHKRDIMKLPTSISTDSIKQDYEYDVGKRNKEIPKRISVTEPSSPAAAYTSKYSALNKVLKMKNDNTESDISESESECHTIPMVSKVRKSQSFVEQKSGKKKYESSAQNVASLHTKNAKVGKAKPRKLSKSSTSSCDSFCPSQSLRRNHKARVNKAEIENTKPLKLSKYESNSLNHPPKTSSKKKRGCGCENIDLQKNLDMINNRRYRDEERKVRGNWKCESRERERSASRDAKNRDMPSSSRMNAEMYLHLLDVLLQKNQNENSKDIPHQNYTKSLPRNHRSKNQSKYPHEFSHHLTTAIECEKDCLKILKSFSEKSEGSPAYRGVQKKDGNYYMDFTPKKKLINSDHKGIEKKCVSETCSWRRLEPSITRCGCAPYACCNSFCDHQRKKCFPKTEQFGKYKNENGMARGRMKDHRRNDEECVIRIEDEKLWIKICKAVEEVNMKDKNLRKSD